MTDVSRRHFLTGTVASAAAGTALVLAAPERALELFQPTRDEILAITRMPAHYVPPRLPRLEPVECGEMLYNAKGEAVVVVTRISIGSSLYSASSLGDEWERHYPGLLEIDIQVKPVFRHLEFYNEKG